MAHGLSASLVALLVAGCAGVTVVNAPPSPGSPASPGAAGALALTDADVEAIVGDTGAARQLQAKRPVEVVRLELPHFKARLLGHSVTMGASPPNPGDAASAGGAGETDLSPDAAFLLGFDFVPRPDKRAGVSSMEEVLAEQVVGFYDLKAAKVFIPDVHLKSEGDLLEQRAVLAHEVHHALQAQIFAKAPPPASEDEALAQLALVEGDAQVAMGAWLGARAGAPVGRTLRRIVEVTRQVPLASITRGEESRKLDKALELTRRRLEFPYREGMLFVSDVYRAGGFPLVDKMYGSPPRSTEQVLHPEKYLAGEEPRPVADPRPPRGYTLSVAGTLGELDTRVLLQRCLDADVAERAAAGWGGDRYAVFAGPERRLATAWISAWDTEQDADEAETALRKSAACWHDNALGRAQADFTIGADVQVRRQGKLVAFLRGFPARDAAPLQAHLFSLVGPEPKPKPRSDLKIPPRVRLPEPTPGRLDGDVYRNDWIGVTGRVPPGVVARAGGDVDLVVERPDVLVHGGVTVSTRITSDAENEKTFREAQDAFAAAASQLAASVQPLGGGPVRTALGAGVERTWRVAGTAVELRLVLVPICAGTGSIVFRESYGDTYARSVLDGWMGSFRWQHGRNLVACDFLDPK
jgi:hypothetical protein